MAKTFGFGRLGAVLLGIYLIVVGVTGLVAIAIPGLHVIEALLAIAAGILVLMGR